MNIKNFYQCNEICHCCRARKETYMHTELDAARHSTQTFLQECVKKNHPR